ncbi:MAG TPA: carboxypeptidase regulatory-like domain-containing protein [Planctomycetes bacterium]|nr:carboxypeptidase regulatory-like domain-containing protein [Planctomycetota bacterium]
MNLRMVRAGTVDGRLLDADGSPAEGVVVTLTHLPDRETREVKTDELGVYLFDPVLDGAWELGVGPIQNPILDSPRTLRVQSPGTSVPDIELPPLAALDLTYFDGDDERLLPEVLVTGSGLRGGAFEARTDSYGNIHVSHLPPGRWRVRASVEGYRDRRDQFELEAGKTETTTLGMARE